MTVNILIQIDKLVQLLESPVFTCEYFISPASIPEAPTNLFYRTDLRLQLLEPEKYPHLYKCLYGILMLLPQSSAFAALKNRLNSVSAIGYLHIAPRGYVSDSFLSTNKIVSGYISAFEFPIRTSHSLQEKHTHHSINSTPVVASSSSSNYDRPNRLKGRDEGGIRWVELLEKFKTVQEKARRSLKSAGEQLDDGIGGGFNSDLRNDIDPRAVADLARLQTPTPPLIMGKAGGTGAGGQGQTGAQGHKSRSSLSHKFGRLGGGISSRPKK